MVVSHELTMMGAMNPSTRTPVLVVVAAVVMLLAGCGTVGKASTTATQMYDAVTASQPPTSTSGVANESSTVPPVPASDSTLPVGDRPGDMPAPGTCTITYEGRNALPDRNCTPGSINSTVTQDNLDDTICKSGWTKTVRPPTSVTNKMKAASAKSYNIASNVTGEYDHLVSLQLGGAPADPRNLWVEPGSIPNEKDNTENRLNYAVCSRLIPLAVAQHAIASDWVTALGQAGLSMSGSKVCLTAQPTRCASSRNSNTD
jgi:uncharacterized protein YceK